MSMCIVSMCIVSGVDIVNGAVAIIVLLLRTTEI